MLRDWDLIREILLRAENKLPGGKMLHTEISGHLLLQVGDHIAVLHDAGYVRAVIVRAHGYVMLAAVTEITRQGRELLAILRSNTVWQRVKRIAGMRGVDLSFEYITQCGTAELDRLYDSLPAPRVNGYLSHIT